MIKVFIVDDSQGNLEVVEMYLQSLFPTEVEVVGSAGTIESAFDGILSSNPDLLILDIQLREGTSFDLLDQIMKSGRDIPDVIFVTAFGKYEYATRAFEYAAIDFLPKPIDPDKLEHAVNRSLKMRNGGQNSPDQIKMLLEYVKNGATKNTKLALHRIKGVIEFVEVDQILYLEADGTLSKVFMLDNTNIIAMRNLGHYASILTKDFRFAHISNKHLVNMEYVKSYNHSELAIKLSNGTVLYASRRGGSDFKRLLG